MRRHRKEGFSIKTIGKPFKKVGEVAKDAGGKVADTGKSVGGKVASGAKTAGGKIASTAKTVGGKLGGFFKGVWTWLLSMGKFLPSILSVVCCCGCCFLLGPMIMPLLSGLRIFSMFSRVGSTARAAASMTSRVSAAAAKTAAAASTVANAGAVDIATTMASNGYV